MPKAGPARRDDADFQAELAELDVAFAVDDAAAWQ